MSSFLEKAWYRSAPWLLLLAPLSKLFGFLAARRRRQFEIGRRTIYRAPVPVVVVGNITVGGTGKTPLTIALAEKLMGAGFNPGIVSRGYGSRSPNFPLTVTADTDVSLSGDEALLLARHLNCPVVIDPDRPAACRKLLKDFPDCNVILSDDGLQHYALARDIEIAVLDGARGLGNGFLLPAGPLREPKRRLEEVDYVVINGDADNSLAPHGYTMQLEETELVSLASGEHWAVTDINSGQTVHAVAGIGNPRRFFDSLSACGFAIIAHAFPDHHVFRQEDIRFDDGLEVIMTEKDAVKCLDFCQSPDAPGCCQNCWYLKVAAHLPEEFFNTLLDRLKTLQSTAKTELNG